MLKEIGSMRKDLLSLVLLVGLTSVVVAQEATPQMMPVGDVVVMPAEKPVPEVAEAAEAVPVAQPAVVAPCAVPCEPCCTPMKKVCVPAPGKKTTTHVEYGHKCEDFCLPACGLSCLFGSRKSCADCESCEPCIDCEKPRERKKLVKKFRKEECDIVKCEVQHVPDCEPCKAPRWKKAKAECCPVTCEPCVPAPCTTVVVPSTPAVQPLPR